MERQQIATTNQRGHHREMPPAAKPVLSNNVLIPPLLQLQRGLGNLAFQHLWHWGVIQAKLKFSQPGDIYEQEADRVAELVMRMPEPGLDLAADGSASTIRRNYAACSSGDAQCPECTDEEEEKLVHRKPLASEITPLIQRQATQEPEEEEEETLQKKPVPGGITTVSPSLESHINSMQGGGQPLPPTVRAFSEPRFGYDFSEVRVHTDSQAADSARAVNALAYTVGRDIMFGARQYAPETNDGQRLLAHELVHVVQQRENRVNQVQRWSAPEHGKISKEAIDENFKDDFSFSVSEKIANYSGEMDIRTCNYVVEIIGTYVPGVNIPVHYLLRPDEAPNHGEANLYERTDRIPDNEKRMKSYTDAAIENANAKGISKQSLLELGNALHVGQDRGAHEEGLPGRGHKRESDPDDPSIKWGHNDADDPKKNWKGRIVAKEHSRKILGAFLHGLNESAKAGLKTTLGIELPEALELTSGIALTKGEPQFYAGIGVYEALPEHVGIWSPVAKGGYGFVSGTKQMVTLTEEAGLRITKITHRIYVDVLGGGFVGYDFRDKSLMAGVSAIVQANYTGTSTDFGLMLKKLYDLVGGRDVLVVGVSVHW